MATELSFLEVHDNIVHDKKYLVGLWCGVGIAVAAALLLVLLSDMIAEMNQEHIFAHSGLVFTLLLWPFLDIPGVSTNGSFKIERLIKESAGSFIGGISAAVIFKAVDFTTPTIVGVVATVEIILVLLIEILVVHDVPNMLKIAGCIIVSLSIVVIVLDEFLTAKEKTENVRS